MMKKHSSPPLSPRTRPSRRSASPSPPPSPPPSRVTSPSEFTTPAQKFRAYAKRRARFITSDNLAKLPYWPGYEDAFVNPRVFRWMDELPSPSRMSFLPCRSPPASLSPSPPPPPPSSPDYLYYSKSKSKQTTNLTTTTSNTDPDCAIIDSDSESDTDMPASASASTSAERGRFLTLPDVHVGESHFGRDSTADEMNTLVSCGSEIGPAERELRWNLVTEHVMRCARYGGSSDGQGIWCERDPLQQQAWRIARYTERLMYRLEIDSENEKKIDDYVNEIETELKSESESKIECECMYDDESESESENENENDGECQNPITTNTQIDSDSDSGSDRYTEIVSRSMTDVSNDSASDSDDEFMNAVQYI